MTAPRPGPEPGPPEIPQAIARTRSALGASALLAAALGIGVMIEEPRHVEIVLFAFVVATACALVSLFGFRKAIPTGGAALAEALAVAGLIISMPLPVIMLMAGRITPGMWPATIWAVVFGAVQVAQLLWSSLLRKALVAAPNAEGVVAADTARPGLLARVGQTLIVLFVVMVLAALFIPSNVHRRRLDATQISDMRTILSAQVAYSSANEGRYGPLHCLATPSECLREYKGPVFIAPPSIAPQREGYRRTFHAGREVPTSLGTGLESFTYAAVPLERKGTSQRSFCTDETGVIFQDLEAGDPVVNGRCRATLPALN